MEITFNAANMDCRPGYDKSLVVNVEFTGPQMEEAFAALVAGVTAHKLREWIANHCGDILEEEYERGREDGQHEGN